MISISSPYFSLRANFAPTIDPSHAGLPRKSKDSAAGHNRPDLHFRRRRDRRPGHQAGRNPKSTSYDRPPCDPISLGHINVLLLNEKNLPRLDSVLRSKILGTETFISTRAWPWGASIDASTLAPTLTSKTHFRPDQTFFGFVIEGIDQGLVSLMQLLAAFLTRRRHHAVFG
jgi:hypothetical protein